MVIYLVQSTTDLKGGGGYCYGLLQAEHEKLLVTFAEMKGRPLLPQLPVLPDDWQPPIAPTPTKD